MFDILGGIIITVGFICFGIYRYIRHNLLLSELIGGSLIIAGLFTYSSMNYAIGLENAEFIRFFMILIGALCEVQTIKKLKEQIKKLKNKSKLINNGNN